MYGPVNSWRVGRSLGVDLLCVGSVCSFRCVYCQLGRINVRTSERRVYVPTAKVMEDLRASAWRGADVVTLSGSGEPTLAANMGEVIVEIKRLTRKPVLVLTNSAQLASARVRRELCGADMVFCKLDAADEETFRSVNRPVAEVTLRSTVEGIRRLREEYAGRLAVQLMLMPLNKASAREFAPLLGELRPDEVQLNSPLRPVPKRWTVDARGNLPQDGAAVARLKTVPAEEFAEFADELRRLTGLKIVSRPGDPGAQALAPR
ncbi:MAG TPA: radical SAM protein [Pyrinomonadaceae bacterium]|nr:radical SAM protein [Pyrinomonadaceae bacterium]